MLKFSFEKRNKKILNIKLINSVIDVYNSKLYKYCRDNRGRIPKIKEDFSSIPQNKFMNLDEYLNSVPIWNQISLFMKEYNKDVRIEEFIDVMMKNWRDIAAHLNSNFKRPLARIIFSEKLIYLYDKYVEKSEDIEIMNKHLAAKKTNDFYRLSPSLQSNVNSLFKLKKLNTDMSYKDIVSIFSGEFESKFVDVISAMKEEEIVLENLVEIFS